MKTTKQIGIFYDGSCGLCHAFVRFSLTRMRVNQPFFFAPQEGETFRTLKDQFHHTFFPDSIIVCNMSEQKIFTKSEGIVEVLTCLKWPWRGFGYLLKMIPIRASNGAYDYVAKVRYQLFQKPKNDCPIVPQEWKKFFKN